jgi:type VI secretion system secreted protein VgrG
MAITQKDRPMAVQTPLGPDVLILGGFTGNEGISQLFRFHCDMLAERKKDIPFEKLLGQPITIDVEMAPGKKRHFAGIVNRIKETGHTDEFTTFHAEFVPEFWLLTKRVQSRIFQQMSVPDILKKVLTGLKVTFQIQGTFQPRDFCVQYRESDFAFASRLMEEEGIFYFFTHSDNGHTMVVANTPQSHPDLPGDSKVAFLVPGKEKASLVILNLEKRQELRSGKVTLWDHCFQLPHKHLEASKTIQDSLSAGGVNHALKVANNDKLELYDYPGAYAQRFDDIDKGGGEKPADLQNIFQDNARTATIRMQQEAVASLILDGTSWCKNFMSGHKFTLGGHAHADGAYVLVTVDHGGSMPGVRSGGGTYSYSNTFSCIPFGMPFRPPRTTPRSLARGPQTAVVVGPPGEEIFTDKYGRVKVQFHWDREGKNDANSSCWIRVGTPWAGKQWGMLHIPRIGQEVIVDFLEGDPDQPIITGSVYNADQMPPYKLPDNKTQSGVKSRSTLNGDAANFNELRFEDKKGSEDVYFHAEKDFHRVVENDDDLKVGNDQTIEIKKNRTEKVKEGDEKVTIEKGDRTVVIGMGNETLTIKMGNQTTKINLGKSETEAMQSIELKVGQSSVKLDQTGVTIKGLMINVEGTVQTQVKAPMTQVTADAMLQLKGGITMIG